MYSNSPLDRELSRDRANRAHRRTARARAAVARPPSYSLRTIWATVLGLFPG